MTKLLSLVTLSTIILSTSAMAEETKQNINLGLVSTTGNTKTLNLNGKYDLKSTTRGYNNQDLNLLFDASAFMTENNNVKDNEEYQVNLGVEQLIYNGWLGYASAGWLKNKFLNFDNKIGIGAGIGKELYKDNQQTLTAKLGVAYNIEDYSNAQVEHKFTSLNQYVEYNNQLNKVSNFFLKVGALENFKDFSNDYEAFGTVGFNFAVAENLTVTLSEEIRYDNTPALGFKKTDSKTLATVGYHF